MENQRQISDSFGAAFFALLLALGFTFPGLLSASSSLGAWEDMGMDEGVHVWKRGNEGTRLFAFKGEAIIDAPIERVASVLNDTPRRLEWVHNAAEATRLEESENGLKRVEYNHTSVPWPLKDRDFVFAAQVSLRRAKKSGEKNEVYIRMQSLDDSDPRSARPGFAPRECCVRGQIHESGYYLAELEGGKTLARVWINVDSKGSIPAWIANLFQKKWPRRTLAGVIRQVAKKDVQALGWVRAYFDQGKLPNKLKASELEENFEKYPLEK